LVCFAVATTAIQTQQDIDSTSASGIEVPPQQQQQQQLKALAQRVLSLVHAGLLAIAAWTEADRTNATTSSNSAGHKQAAIRGTAHSTLL
jgi:hypothetical protein